MNKTTITITINHELDNQVLHPAHQLIHNALLNYSKHESIKYSIMAVYADDVEQRVMVLNPKKQIAGGLKL